MLLHQLVPLAAFVLNLCLALLALQRDARSRLNRVFALFAAALGIWTFGVFMLRRAPDPQTALAWESFIHAGIAMVPAVYYHFIVSFLGEPGDARGLKRPIPLGILYAVGCGFLGLTLTGSSLFMRGVQYPYWGWAPVPGPLYVVFILWFNATVLAGMLRLRAASRTITSSFRRHRARLIVLGTAVSLAGSATDFLTFLGQRFGMAHVFYPVGVLANMAFSFLLGTSIIRYRMFDVGAAGRQFAVYVSVGGVIAASAAIAIRAGAGLLADHGHDGLWLIVPGAALIALGLSPFGRRAGELLDRVTFRHRGGCYDALLELSGALGAMRTPEEVTSALVEGVAAGIPVTHCTLLTPEPGTRLLTCAREHVIVGMGAADATLAIDGAVVGFLQRTGRLLVREGARTDAVLVGQMRGGADELAGLHATLIVPLRFGSQLAGVLTIGEKLSGELFDSEELDVLGVLAAQAALALDNARLLRESDERLRRAEQLNAELDSFVASTSHDLKAPLVTLEGLSELVLAAEGQTVSPASRRYLERIQMNVRRMAQLVADLLTISRVGRDIHEREAVNVDAIVDEVLDAMADRIRARGVQIVRAPLGRVSALPHDLTSVFTNLISNAIAYLGETAAPRIEIGMREEPDEIEYWVRDNGVGIDPAYHAKVFEMFQRLGEVQTEGTGLGLSTVKKIVDAAGGRVWIDSARGAGTTVRFTWPRTDDALAYRLATAPSAEQSGHV